MAFKRDGICNPVSTILLAADTLKFAETLRTGQHAPSGEASKLLAANCRSIPRINIEYIDDGSGSGVDQNRHILGYPAQRQPFCLAVLPLGQ